MSNQCMALVRDECLLPCKDAPELGFAKESSPEQYVPDVLFKVRLCPRQNTCKPKQQHVFSLNTGELAEHSKENDSNDNLETRSLDSFR